MIHREKKNCSLVGGKSMQNVVKAQVAGLLLVRRLIPKKMLILQWVDEQLNCMKWKRRELACL
jgi:uncharacterized membrane protein